MQADMLILDSTSLLLLAPRNVYTAVGLPLAIGMFSGSHTAKVARGRWYNVGGILSTTHIIAFISRAESLLSAGQSQQ